MAVITMKSEDRGSARVNYEASLRAYLARSTYLEKLRVYQATLDLNSDGLGHDASFGDNAYDLLHSHVV